MYKITSQKKKKKKKKEKNKYTISNFIFFPVFFGVPQGLILCPLFFPIYINKLLNETVSTIKQFAYYFSLLAKLKLQLMN